MSRNARRTAVTLGMAAGAAVIAASFTMGNAPLAHADVLGADTVSDLIAAADPAAADPAAVAAAGVPDTMALSFLIQALDPEAFTSTGVPIDEFGLLGYYADTYFLGPTGLDTALAPLVEELVGNVAPGTPLTYTPEISELIFALDPDSFTSATALTTPTDALGFFGYYTDTYLFGPFGIDNLIAPYIQEIISSLPTAAQSVDVSPVADLFGALDPSAFSSGVTDLAADGLLNSALSLF
jgi:hypothetical protein